MKKILQINILNETGSTGRIMQSISKNILAETDFISLTAYGYGKASKENSIRIGNRFDNLVHNFLSRLFCSQGHHSVVATILFLKKLEEIKPDLIHLHNIHGNYVNYKLLFKYIKKNNIPVVWTLHDCWSFTGKCVHFELCKCNKWKSKCFNCPILNDYPKSYLLDRTKYDFELKKNTFTSIENMYIVTPSEWLASKVSNSFLNKFPITVINNGIDLETFKQRESTLKQKYNIIDKFIILGVASPWSARKGLDDFKKLSYLLSDKFRIVIIGIENNQELGFNDNCIFIRKTENVYKLAEWYSVADIFFNPTYEDTFPTVNLEALACNTPVITYETGGSPEMIKKNCGFVCKQGDINDVLNKINLLINNRENFRNGRKLINEKCNELTAYLSYIHLYLKILKNN